MVFQECYICKKSENDEAEYGKIVDKLGYTVHYFCLLLSSNLVQLGDSDDDGLLGFLVKDIKAEVKRIKPQECFYCKQPYASVHCCHKKCRRVFHVVCGMNKNCLSHFVDTFQSFCHSHVPIKDVKPHRMDEPCAICFDEMGKYNKVSSIRAPCCHNGWFHKQCLSKFALSAGYFFKCPLCNSTDSFKDNVIYRGIHIPEKDAEWELEPNAFSELLERPSECDAENCECPKGRAYDNGKKWDLIICDVCGSTSVHRACMLVPTKSYVCAPCAEITQFNNGASTDAGILENEDVELDEEDEEEGEGSVLSQKVDDKIIEMHKNEDIYKVHVNGHEIVKKLSTSSDESEIHFEKRKTKKKQRLLSISDTGSEISLNSPVVRGKRRCKILLSDDDSPVRTPNTGKMSKRRLSTETHDSSNKNVGKRRKTFHVIPENQDSEPPQIRRKSRRLSLDTNSSLTVKTRQRKVDKAPMISDDESLSSKTSVTSLQSKKNVRRSRRLSNDEESAVTPPHRNNRTLTGKPSRKNRTFSDLDTLSEEKPQKEIKNDDKNNNASSKTTIKDKKRASTSSSSSSSSCMASSISATTSNSSIKSDSSSFQPVQTKKAINSKILIDSSMDETRANMTLDSEISFSSNAENITPPSSSKNTKQFTLDRFFGSPENANLQFQNSESKKKKSLKKKIGLVKGQSNLFRYFNRRF